MKVIEEKEMCHKCHKYPAEYNQTYCEFCLGIGEDKRIEKLDLHYEDIKYMPNFNEEILMYCDNLQCKINEIIDKLNEVSK